MGTSAPGWICQCDPQRLPWELILRPIWGSTSPLARPLFAITFGWRRRNRQPMQKRLDEMRDSVQESSCLARHCRATGDTIISNVQPHNTHHVAFLARRYVVGVGVFGVTSFTPQSPSPKIHGADRTSPVEPAKVDGVLSKHHQESGGYACEFATADLTTGNRCAGTAPRTPEPVKHDPWCAARQIVAGETRNHRVEWLLREKRA